MDPHVGNAPRLASGSPFPYGSRLVCYLVIVGGKPRQLTWAEARDLSKRSRKAIYAAWPGNWRTDLFLLDDIKENQ